MTYSSCSTALSLIALFLFFASTPLPVHGLLPPLFNIPPLIRVPPVGVPPPAGVPPPPPASSPSSTVIVNVVGRVCCTANGNCPGDVLSRVPLGLTCLSNNATTFVDLSLTNADGTFILNANLPTNALPMCAVTISRSALNAAMCQVLGAGGSSVISIVRVMEPSVGRVYNATISGFVTI